MIKQPQPTLAGTVSILLVRLALVVPRDLLDLLVNLVSKDSEARMEIRGHQVHLVSEGFLVPPGLRVRMVTRV